MDSTSLATLIGSTAVDAAVLGLMLFAGKPAKLTAARVRLALLVTILFAAAKALALTLLVQSLFFTISLAYVDAVILAPAAGIAVLAISRRRGATLGARVLAWCALVPAPLGAYATFVEPFRLVEERVEIPLVPERGWTSDLRVAVLSDFQSRVVDDHLRLAVERAMAFEPHLILLPGDLIQRESDEYDAAIPEFRALVRPLAAPLGVYFVLGNTDHTSRVARVFEDTNVRVLVDEVVELDFEGRKIVLGGAGFDPRDARVQSFVRELDARPGDDLRILLAHYPDVVYALPSPARVDLIVAGHTHGGQVQIPFFGPPITLSSVPRAVAAGGYHVLGGRAIYVSRGLGCERGDAPRVRFNAPPEVSLLTLRTEPAQP